MLENMMMPREFGYKSQSYAAEQIDDDVMDALPPLQQDKYIEKKVAPQIEEQLKDIEFDNEADKSKVYRQAVSTKTAKEWGTKHANQLKSYDFKYQDNEYYKQNYISRLQDIINQDSMKTRGGTRTNTTENKERAKELLKAIGIRPELKVAVPQYTPAAAPPATPPREQRAKVIKPEPEKAAKDKAEEKAKEEAETYLRSEPPVPVATRAPPKPPPPPPPAAAGKGPPPPPPPPPKIAISTDLLNELDDTPEEKAAKEKAAKEGAAAAKKGNMVEEMKAQQERAPKQAGTKDGKSLSVYKEKYIDNLNYRKNYKTELEKVLEDEKVSQENREKAKELLDDFDNELIKRAKEFLIKDTSLDTLYPVRNEYKEYKKEYYDPYMKKMKQYQDETKQKYEEENEKLKQYKEMDKQENRKTLTPDKKKKLTKKLEETTDSVKKLKDFLDKINEFSGLK
jgi:hypothetical protein